MKKKRKVYLLHRSMKYKTFKMLQDKLVKNDGIIPQNTDKVLWEMFRDGKILLWFDTKYPGDMKLGLEYPKLPKSAETFVLNSLSSHL